MDPLISLVVIGSSLGVIQNGQTTRLGQLTSFLFAATYIHIVRIIVSTIYFCFTETTAYETPIYTYLGGFLIAFAIYSIGITTEIIGSALTIICVLSSKLILSALIDHFGWFGMPVNQLNASKCVVLLISVLAVLLVSLDSTKIKNEVTENGESSPLIQDTTSIPQREYEQATIILMVIVALLNGVSFTAGSTMLGAMGHYTSVGYASLISSILGFICFLSLFLFDFYIRCNRFKVKTLFAEAEWWLFWIGWPGAIYGIITIYLLPVFGASVFFGVHNSCQILTAIVLDKYGAFGSPKKEPNVIGIIGALTMLISTILLKIL